MLDGQGDAGVAGTLAAMRSLVRHCDVVFRTYVTRSSDDPVLADHEMGMAFMACALGCEAGSGKEEGLGEHTAVILALAGFFHDIGAPLGAEYGSKDFIKGYARHAAKGAKILKGVKLPEAVRYAARDHHKPGGAWHSPFDAITCVVQVANDLDNTTRKNGVLVGDGSVELSPDEVDLREACRGMLFSARRGLYRESLMHGLMRLCGLSALFEYYRQVEVIKGKPCAAVILGPDEVHPVTALCSIEGSVARHEGSAYCAGRSPTRGHAHEGQMYHRCLSGHDEVTSLNANVKHLDARTKQSLGLAGAAEEEAAAALDSTEDAAREGGAPDGEEPEGEKPEGDAEAEAEIGEFEDDDE
jgi:hypothetical protein